MLRVGGKEKGTNMSIQHIQREPTRTPPKGAASPRAVMFGEAMLELSNVSDDQAILGVAGDTFNTATYMSRLGHRVAYMTGLGIDPFSARVRHAADEEDIETHLIATVPGKVVGAYAISLDRAGERSFTYWRSASAARSFFDCEEASSIFQTAANADLLYLTGISLSLYSAENRSLITNLMRQMRENDRWIAFDSNYRPAGWDSVESARSAIQEAVSLSQISLPTFEDEAALFGDRYPEATAERHIKLGAREVVVKCGERGAFVADFGWVAPERIVEPVDTTGAGDSFNGGYLASRLDGLPPHRAAHIGNQLAAAVLGTKGAILPKQHTLFERRVSKQATG
ncbi:MAG: sugar kinase [Henriciella sp.]